MRRLTIIAALLVAITPALAQTPPKPDEKENANPCREEVAAALKKLRNASWFRMDTTMLTEKGFTDMQVDYVLPDRMHQKVAVPATKEKSEIILVGEKAWSKQGEGDWVEVSAELTQNLKGQMQDQVVAHQEEIGNYSCKGRTKLEGRDVMSYKLEEEMRKDSDTPRNDAFRMFYVDAVTGFPVSNAIVVEGRDGKPIFKTNFSFPIDLKIEPPAKVGAASPPAPAAGDAKTP